MSFSNVQLPGFLIADLYKKHLIEDPAITSVKKEKAENAPETSKNIQFLGKNLKEFVILVNYSNEVYLPEAQLEFLGNILKACQLNLGDVAIVNCFTQQVTLDNLSTLQPKFIINFGVQYIDQQLISGALFTIANLNSVNIVNVPSLEVLNQNTPDGKQMKTKLWNCLKQLLNL